MARPRQSGYTACTLSLFLHVINKVHAIIALVSQWHLWTLSSQNLTDYVDSPPLEQRILNKSLIIGIENPLPGGDRTKNNLMKVRENF